MRSGLLALSLAAVLGVGATSAFAAPTEGQKKSARAHFDKGTTQYNLGRFQEAITEFEQGYEQVPDAIFIYNIAQSHRLAGNNERTLFFYKRDLSFGNSGRSKLRHKRKKPGQKRYEAEAEDRECVFVEEKFAQEVADREQARRVQECGGGHRPTIRIRRRAPVPHCLIHRTSLRGAVMSRMTRVRRSVRCSWMSAAANRSRE